MNAWQVAKQLRYTLRNATWQDAGGERIFGSVHITNGPAKEFYNEIQNFPLALIGVNDDETDPMTPGYVKQMFTITFIVRILGDMRGENAMIGANRTAGSTSSKGRGILEVTEEVSRALRQIQESVGVKIVGRRKSDIGTGILEGVGYLALRQSIIEVKCTDARYYHPPLRVAAVKSGANANLTWADPPTRWDGVGRTLRIRRILGSTPPATVTDGSAVADVARGVQAYADTPGAGTWSYSIFAGYSDTGASSNERYSEGTATEDGMSATVTI